MRRPLFAGYRFDDGTSLINVRNRTYHAGLGTWTKRDPIGYSPGTNLYEYDNSNPTLGTDPAGTDPKAKTKRSPIQTCEDLSSDASNATRRAMNNNPRFQDDKGPVFDGVSVQFVPKRKSDKLAPNGKGPCYFKARIFTKMLNTAIKNGQLPDDTEVGYIEYSVDKEKLNVDATGHIVIFVTSGGTTSYFDAGAKIAGEYGNISDDNGKINPIKLKELEDTGSIKRTNSAVAPDKIDTDDSLQ